MRRAGYEVRVLPIEDGSWEENPPTIVDFMQRDVRWCQGNIQYLHLINEPGLKPLSRFQLVWAMLMFLGIPAWTLMIALLPAATVDAAAIADFPVALAAGLYVSFLIMYLSPKLAGFADIALTTGGARRYGGRLRFALGAAIELVFSFLQGAISTIRTTVFHDRPCVWAESQLGRTIARRARIEFWNGAGAALAANTVRGDRVRVALFDQSGNARLELAAHGRISDGDPVCDAHGKHRARPDHGFFETVRNPRGI